MLEEFLSLLEYEKESIVNTLTPYVNEKVFKYFLGGFFDENQTRFMAFAFVPIKKSMFNEYSYIFNLSPGGHNAIYFMPKTMEELKGLTVDNHGRSITSEKYVEEGIYKSFLVTYTAEFDFGEWNILTNFCFSDVKDKNRLLNSRLDRTTGKIKEYFFNSSIFQETAERYKKIVEHHKESVNPLYEIGREVPFAIPVDMKPFVGHSNLVYLVRTKKKAELNLAFQEYINKAIFKPLVIYLKTNYPDKYGYTLGFFAYECIYLVPSHRQFCLIIFAAKDGIKKTILHFFLYHLQENKVYRWIYFQSHPYKGNLNESSIIDAFSSISTIDNIDYFLNMECNFDDQTFWEDLVIKKNNDSYLYLEELPFTISVY
jgi:hypothetical protein